jgi:hypothetical protein
MFRNKNKDGTTRLDGGALTLASAINALYPVGALYMTTVATNPGTGSPAQFPGTTWVAWGAGRAVVGVGSNGTNTYTSEQTFGVDSITLTAAQSGVNDHTHAQTLAAPAHTHTDPSHSHTIDFNYIVGPNPSGTGFNFIVSMGGTFNADGTDSQGTSDAAGGGQTGTASATALTGAMGAVSSPTGATAHENRPSSIATYIWKRTA